MQKIENVCPKSSSETYISLQYFTKYIYRTMKDFSNINLFSYLKKKTKCSAFHCEDKKCFGYARCMIKLLV